MNSSVSTPFPGEDPAGTRSSLIHRLKDWEDHGSWQDFFDCASPVDEAKRSLLRTLRTTPRHLHFRLSEALRVLERS